MSKTYRYIFPSNRRGNKWFTANGKDEVTEAFYCRYVSALPELSVEEQDYIQDRYERMNQLLKVIRNF
jgi:hypothetical protein